LPNAPLELQGNARVEHLETSGGLSFRIHQGPMFSAGVDIQKKFSVGYVRAAPVLTEVALFCIGVMEKGTK
jgi:hypothetical protein